MGDENNYGITWPLNWLIGNATNEVVLFLEKDFQLVESGDCAIQQIAMGKQMLEVCVWVGGMSCVQAYVEPVFGSGA
jgi:hypothetical protein